MATSNTTPVVIPQPIAAQATSENINVIPNGATGTNRASFQEGFPAITRLPVIENPLPTQVSGLPPKQQDFNGLFNVVSQHNFFAQNGGLYSFNQAVSDAIGGYAKNQILWYFPATGLPYPVVSMIDNNTYNFVETPSYIDGEKWKSIVANASLDNLTTAGQAKFNAKANTDLGNLSTAGQAILNGKADINASNFTAAGKERIVGWGMPDYTTGVSFNFVIGGTFTAPYDCCVKVVCSGSGNAFGAKIYNTGVYLARMIPTTGQYLSDGFVLSKGDRFVMEGSGVSQLVYFKLKGVI